jgi:beta-glucanase (GH16 family)
MATTGTWTRVLGVCALIAIGAFSLAAMPAVAGAAKAGHTKAGVHKKKCKKRGKSARKKCKRPHGKQVSGSGAASSPAPDACGPRVPKSTGGYWACSFVDNFDGTSLDRSKWLPQVSATSGYLNGPTACFVDSPNNISVSDGTLNLTARKEPAPFDCAEGYTMRYTSGMVTTALGRFSQTYGRFEVRARIPPAQVRGLQTSLWLWPVNSNRYGPYPASGELDVAEMFSQYPDRAIPYIHYNSAAESPNVTNTSCMIRNLSAFHTYTLEWTSSSVRISYDGQLCLAHYWDPASPLSRPQPFDQPFFIALTQALGVGTNEFDPGTTPLPATTMVDYVRAWK